MGIKLWDIGKKAGQVLIPNVLLNGAIIGLNFYFNTDINLKDAIIYNILVAIAYVLLWHELRLREVEF